MLEQVVVRRRRRERVKTVLIPVNGTNPIHAEISVPPGQILTAIEVAKFNEGDKLVPGRLYCTPAGWSRCIDGPRGPLLPARDRHALRGDGSDGVIGYLVRKHCQHEGDFVAPSVLSFPSIERNAH